MNRRDKAFAVASLVIGTMAMSLAVAMTGRSLLSVIIHVTASVLMFTNAVLILYRDDP